MYKKELADGIHIRAIVLASPLRNKNYLSSWEQPQYNAQEILQIIEELKPTVLERYITGKQDPDMLVPTAPGYPPMTVAEFLTASMKAGAPGCIIIPKINLKWDDDHIIAAARNLYDLPVDPPLRVINLDNWNDFCQTRAEDEIKRIFQKLVDMGWQDMGLNYAGGYKDAYGYASFGDFLIDKTKWEIRTSTLEKLKKDPAVKWQYLYIDYPGQMEAFAKLPTDQQAQVLQNVVAPAQFEHGFRFVYPILQDFWDAKAVFTSKDGPYGGVSMYEVMKMLIELDRKNGSTF